MSKKAREANLYYCAGIVRPNANAVLYGQWLLESAKAQNMLVELKASGDKDVKEALDRLDSCELDFEYGAIDFLAEILRTQFFYVAMTSYEAELMAMFVHMGFLKREGDFYAIAVPKTLCAATVREAVLALANTEDAGCMLHPHRVLMAHAA